MTQTFTPEDLAKIEELYFHGDPKALVRDDEYAAMLAARSATPVYCMAAPEVMDVPDRDTFLWRYLITACQAKYPGYVWRPQHQKSGTCAGQTTKLGADTVAAIGSLLYADEFPGRFSVAAMYAGARVEIANQGGRWEGAAMSWMADWITKYGALLLAAMNLDPQDLDNDEKLALQWTNSREGVPAQYETLAKQLPIEGTALALSAREVGKAIQNGNPAIQGSNLIPNGKRDSSGFSRLQGGGGHATLFWAVRYNPFGLLYQNSWSGLWGTGPVFPDDQPAGSVWLDEDESNAIIKQRQTYILFKMAGLKPRFKLLAS